MIFFQRYDLSPLSTDAGIMGDGEDDTFEMETSSGSIGRFRSDIAAVERWEAFLPRQFAGQFVRNAALRPLIGYIIVHGAEEIKRDDRSKRSSDFASRIILCASWAGYFRINVKERARGLRFSKKMPKTKPKLSLELLSIN